MQREQLMPPASPPAMPALAHWRTHLLAWLRGDLPIIVCLMLAALLVLLPVLDNPRSEVIGWQGDNVQFVYITGWMGQAVLLGESPFVDPRLNFPGDLTLAVTDIPYLTVVLAAPLTWAGGPVFTYNLLIWLYIWLSGYVVYRWLWQITRSRGGALVGGLIFLLTPYRVAHSYGHLPYVATYALPLFFWTLDTALRVPLRWWRRGLLVLVATALLGSSSQYYLFIGLLLGVVYALLTLLPLLREGRVVLARSAAIVPAVLVGAAIGAAPYLANLDDNTFAAHPVESTRIWSLDPLNFLLPHQLHPLWGDLVAQVRPEPLWIEKTLYLGVVALVLAGLAWRWRQHPQPWQRWVWLGVAVVAAVLALGTDLHLNNQPLNASDPFWLPAYYLAQLPFTGLVRGWGRFGIITILFVSLLAGIGATAVIRQAMRPVRQFVVAGLLCVLVVVDLLPGMVETSMVQPHPVDQWLAAQSGDFAVGWLPAGLDAVNYPAMYGSLYHSKHLPAYNHPNHRQPEYQQYVALAQSFPHPDAVAGLRQMGLRYLLIDTRFYDGQHPPLPPWADFEAQLRATPGVRVVQQVDGVVVVAVE